MKTADIAVADMRFNFKLRRGKKNIKKTNSPASPAQMKYGLPAIKKELSFEITNAKKQKCAKQNTGLIHKTIISIVSFLKINALSNCMQSGASAKTPPTNGRAGEVYHIFLNIGAPSPK